jgi:hypothetical protein
MFYKMLGVCPLLMQSIGYESPFTNGALQCRMHYDNGTYVMHLGEYGFFNYILASLSDAPSPMISWQCPINIAAM